MATPTDERRQRLNDNRNNALGVRSTRILPVSNLWI